MSCSCGGEHDHDPGHQPSDTAVPWFKAFSSDETSHGSCFMLLLGLTWVGTGSDLFNISGYIGDILGSWKIKWKLLWYIGVRYWDNGKENGNYCNGCYSTSLSGASKTPSRFVSFQAAILGDNPTGPCLIGREGSRGFPRKSHPKP